VEAKSSRAHNKSDSSFIKYGYRGQI